MVRAEYHLHTVTGRCKVVKLAAVLSIIRLFLGALENLRFYAQSVVYRSLIT